VHCANSAFPGIDSDGGYAELLKTNARSVVKLDPSLEPADVAALADAGLTAIHAVRKAAAALRPSHKVVVIGAGGLGHIGIQVLRSLSPAEIIVIDRSPDALKLAEQLGAHHVVEANGTQVEAVKDLTGGHGAEAVLDFVGEGGAVEDGVAMLRRAGSYYVIGYGGRIDVPTIDVISTEINFIGNLVGSYADLSELMVLAARGLVTLHTARYPLEEFGAALHDLEQGTVRDGRFSSPDPRCAGSRRPGFGTRRRGHNSSTPRFHTLDDEKDQPWPRTCGSTSRRADCCKPAWTHSPTRSR